MAPPVVMVDMPTPVAPWIPPPVNRRRFRWQGVGRRRHEPIVARPGAPWVPDSRAGGQAQHDDQTRHGGAASPARCACTAPVVRSFRQGAHGVDRGTLGMPSALLPGSVGPGQPVRLLRPSHVPCRVVGFQAGDRPGAPAGPRTCSARVLATETWIRCRVGEVAAAASSTSSGRGQSSDPPSPGATIRSAVGIRLVRVAPRSGEWVSSCRTGR
jgi:hypothetical protein